MSRYAERTSDSTVVEYGYDAAGIPGYFYAIKENGELVEAGDTRSMMVCSAKEKHMKRSEIVEVLEDYGVNDNHIEAMELDQPF